MKFLKTKKYSILLNILKYGIIGVFAFVIIAPVVFSANPTDGITVTSTINNPLGDKITDIPSFIKEAISIVLTIGIPIIALAIIYVGFLFVMAQGKPDKIKEAKKALANTLIGAALLLGAFIIAEAIGSTVDEIKKGV